MFKSPFRQVACYAGIECSVAADRHDVDAGLFHLISPSALWEALAPKQSVFRWPLDCFASLAMTWREFRHTIATNAPHARAAATRTSSPNPSPAPATDIAGSIRAAANRALPFLPVPRSRRLQP